jgi:hypothetical protein
MNTHEKLDTIIEQLQKLEDAIELSCNEWQGLIFSSLEEIKLLKEELSSS